MGVPYTRPFRSIVSEEFIGECLPWGINLAFLNMLAFRQKTEDSTGKKIVLTVEFFEFLILLEDFEF